ncbi:glycosyltransferase [Amylibacter sp.]|nr:glycosyltransferase [Amylibacter sp.]
MVFHQRKEKKSWLHNLNSKIETFVLRNIKVFTVSMVNKEYLEKYFSKKIPIYIFNLPYFPLKNKSQNYKKNKDICDIICVGRFDTVKGHQRLIEWFYENKNKVYGYHLHLVGEGPLKKELKAQVERRNLINHVTFHGHIDRSKLLDIYSLSDIMVCPSYSEAAPVTFLEGIEFRMPVFVFEESLILYENNFHIKDFFKGHIYANAINWENCEVNAINAKDAFKVFEPR